MENVTLIYMDEETPFSVSSDYDEYTGDTNGGHPDLYGTLKYINGDMFRGQFTDGDWKNGTFYVSKKKTGTCTETVDAVAAPLKNADTHQILKLKTTAERPSLYDNKLDELRGFITPDWEAIYEGEANGSYGYGTGSVFSAYIEVGTVIYGDGTYFEGNFNRDGPCTGVGTRIINEISYDVEYSESVLIRRVPSDGKVKRYNRHQALVKCDEYYTIEYYENTETRKYGGYILEDAEKEEERRRLQVLDETDVLTDPSPSESQYAQALLVSAVILCVSCLALCCYLLLLVKRQKPRLSSSDFL